MQVYRGDGKNGILANICMTVLEAGSCRGEQGLNELGLAQLAEESQSIASNVFVGMLQVIANTVATRFSQ